MVGQTRGVILPYILVSFYFIFFLLFFFLLCLMSLDTPDFPGYLRASFFPNQIRSPYTWIKIWALCCLSYSVQYNYY